jgi:putative phage-type endonuclease
MNDLSKLIQNTPEWLAARCGSLGASDLHKALARNPKGTGWGLTRAALRRQLGAERMTGKPTTSGYQNQNMITGQERESAAREAYCWERGVDVEQVGLIIHPRIEWTHASPDGLVGDDGLVEIKCPTQEVHYDNLGGAQPSGAYLLQCCWQLSCTGRQWVDLCSYNPDFEEGMQLLIVRIQRDDDAIAEAEKQVEAFLAEVEQEIADRRQRYQGRIAA